MSEPAEKKAIYEDLQGIPENMTGEIIDGELLVHPRPSRKHIITASFLGGELIPPYCHAKGGGPGGWIILVEPEIQLGDNTLVPDLAGWKKERFPAREEQNSISVPPDWVCEVLSPATALGDRTKKMRIYGEHVVPFLWLIDPISTTLEAYKLESGRWFLLFACGGTDKVRLEPFQEIEIDLDNLWLELPRT